MHPHIVRTYTYGVSEGALAGGGRRQREVWIVQVGGRGRGRRCCLAAAAGPPHLAARAATRCLSRPLPNPATGAVQHGHAAAGHRARPVRRRRQRRPACRVCTAHGVLQPPRSCFCCCRASAVEAAAAASACSLPAAASRLCPRLACRPAQAEEIASALAYLHGHDIVHGAASGLARTLRRHSSPSAGASHPCDPNPNPATAQAT